jgi:recombination protein RecA
LPLEDVQKYIQKRTGTDLIRRGNTSITYSHVSSGIFILDFALLGGVPENCVITLVGKQHSGKTTEAYKIIGNFQKKYGNTKNYYFLDVEKQYNSVWAKANGVDVDNLYVVTPTNAEEAVDITCELMDDPDTALVVFDSIPALVGTKELLKSAEDALSPGAVAVHANRMLRKVSSSISIAHNAGRRVTLIDINQWRDGIGSAPHMPRTMPGGKYSRHYASVEIEIYNDKQVTGADENSIIIVDHNEHSFKIHKNRIGNSITEGTFYLNRNTANGMPLGYVDDSHTVVTYAQKFNLAGGAGKGWWLQNQVDNEPMKFGSKGDIEEYVRNNPEIKTLVERKVISLHRKKCGMQESDWW